ncbi:MAG: helix-turn-helix transcriptional regulator [Myxococcota bacterium]
MRQEHTATKPGKVSAVGWMLRDWRAARGLSQLDLAQEAGVSTRHLSFVETGRAEPSRELLLKLSTVLGMPPRERNALLSSAGYQPIYKETPLGSPGMDELHHAVTLLLKQAEPFGSVALDRDFDVVMCNRGFATFAAMLLGPERAPKPFELTSSPRLNLLDLTFDPVAGARKSIRNWEQVARAVLWRARAELAATRDRHGREILERIMRLPGVAELASSPDESSGQGLILPLELELPGVTLRMFTTITTLGTPQDLTACELRIETYHPADAATEQLVRAMAG